MQGRVQRAVLYLKEIVGCLLNVLGNLMSIRRPQYQSPHDQHVELPLEQFNPFTSCHSKVILPRLYGYRVDGLPCHSCGKECPLHLLA